MVQKPVRLHYSELGADCTGKTCRSRDENHHFALQPTMIQESSSPPWPRTESPPVLPKSDEVSRAAREPRGEISALEFLFPDSPRPHRLPTRLRTSQDGSRHPGEREF